jgi:hypothetical protein
VRFYILTAVTINITVFWDVMPCILVGRCRFRPLQPPEICYFYYNFPCCVFPDFPSPLAGSTRASTFCNPFVKDHPFKGHIFHTFLLAAIGSLSSPDPVFLLPISLLHISRLSLLPYPEDGGSTFLRNFGRKLPYYMTSNTRRHEPRCPKRWASL